MSATEPQVRMRGEQRREQLLDVALELFAGRGYEGTSIRDIAAAAQVTDGLIYKYFASKDELLVEVIARAGERLRDLGLGDQDDLPLEQGVAGILRVLAEFMRANMPLVDLIRSTVRRCSGEPVAEALRLGVMAKVRAPLAAWCAAGRLQLDDLEWATRLLTGWSFAFATFHEADDEAAWQEEMNEFTRHASRLFVDGARPREDSSAP